MVLKRAFPILLMMLTLAGCFRQASDTFDTVDSSGSGDDLTTIIETVAPTDVPVLEEPTIAPTDEITIIDPNDVNTVDSQNAEEEPTTVPVADPATATPVEIADAQTDDTDTSGEDGVDATATIVIINPTDAPTAVLPPTSDGSEDVAGGDATDEPESTFITPMVESEFVEPTIEPTATDFSVAAANDDDTTDGVADGEPTAIATPTAIGATRGDDEETDSECEIYTIRPGDTLFNIALANDTTVSSLRELNELDSNIIRPNQELILFPCDEDDAEATPEPETVEDDSTPTPAGTFEYTVRAGDTLYALAIRYGTTIDTLIELNELDNPNALSLGDVLLIPEE